jgi:hypothetical protein
MNAQAQSIAALALVALAAALLIARALRRRRPGCGGDCGCATRGPRGR